MFNVVLTCFTAFDARLLNKRTKTKPTIDNMLKAVFTEMKCYIEMKCGLHKQKSRFKSFDNVITKKNLN